MPVLNARSAESWKSGPKRQEISDRTLRPFKLVVQPSGVKSYAVRYSFAGKRVKQTLGAFGVISFHDARERAKEALQSAEKGLDPRTVRKPTTDEDGSFAAAVTLYDERYITTLRPGSASNARRELAHAVKFWGPRRLISITRKDVIALADAAEKRGRSVRGQCVKALSAFFRWCESRDMIEHAPTNGVRRTRDQSRDRVLDDAELAAVWRAADAARQDGAFVKLLILTGCRRDEIAKLEWSEVTADAIVLAPGRTKNGQRHKIALSDAMRDVLANLPHTGRYVLNGLERPMRINGRHKDRLAVKLAEPWRFHDLRRSFASGCARIGVDPFVIERCLNHVVGGVMAIYNRHKYDAECRAGWEAWSKHVLSLAGATGSSQSPTFLDPSHVL